MVFRRVNAKLAARLYGPFRVLEKIGSVAYKLQLPLGSKIHPVFHASQLKKAIGTHHVQTNSPAEMEGDGTMAVEPEIILAQRAVSKRGVQVLQWLIKWKSKPIDEATWEDMETICHCIWTWGQVLC